MKILKTLKKLLSVTLCAALIGGAAITVPAVVQDSAIIADALTYGDYEYDVSNNAVTITRYKGSASSVSIPSSIDGKHVTSIGEYAFFEYSNLESIEIPDSVTSIGDFAFCYCSSITSLYIPDSVTKIGHYAFAVCSNLTNLILPDNEVSIGDYAFYECSNLENFIIPFNCSSIGDEAFSQTAWYDNQPDGIVYAGRVLYRYKGDMPENTSTSIAIPDRVTSISNNAFCGCTGLVSIFIPDSVRSIGDSAFYECNKLTIYGKTGSYAETYANSKNIPFIDPSIDDSDEDLYEYSINDNTVTITGYNGNGTEINIPSKIDGKPVMSIGRFAFSYCTNLTSITLPDSVTSIGGGAFSSCENLDNIILPSGLASIERSMFSYCSSLTSIIIPDSVTSIREHAFSHCSSLTSITIPKSVKNIDHDEEFSAWGVGSANGVFGECINLKEIIVETGNEFYSSVDGILYNKNKTEQECKTVRYQIRIMKTVPNVVKNIYVQTNKQKSQKRQICRLFTHGN